MSASEDAVVDQTFFSDEQLVVMFTSKKKN